MIEMKKVSYILIALIGVMSLSLQSCSKWNTTEAVGHQFVYPWNQNPETWEKYFDLLSAYKGREHSICYASFDNGNDKGDGELNYMRSLPDSLDIVSLTNADNFSKEDLEDMSWMHRMGTKVLYHVDYASRKGEFPDISSLEKYLNNVVQAVEEYKLDGCSFSGIPDYSATDPMVTEAAALLVSKLKVDGKLLVFEGNPKFVLESDRAKLDYVVLNTYSKEYEQDIKVMIAEAKSLGIQGKQLLLSANMEGVITTSSLKEVRQIDKISSMTISQGPTAGMAVYGIASDYYHTAGNYLDLRALIQKLNPSK